MLRKELTPGKQNVSGAEIAAAVSNAGGLGVIGGVQKTPKILKREIDELKALLKSPDTPFGVDLLLPKVGEGARATNYDYTNGELPQLIDIIIESGAKLFVSAVGVPPKWVVDKLHKHGVLVQNMIGAPQHAVKALEVGVDILCAQGTEGGGHTGDIATTVLIPQVVDLVRGKLSPLTGKQVPVIAAGGIYDGRGLAAALAMGAQGVWVGTRFVACEESKAASYHQQAVLKVRSDQTIRSTIYTGRPMRVAQNAHNMDWENQRKKEMLELQAKGVIPFTVDQKDFENGSSKYGDAKDFVKFIPLLMGQAAGAIHEILPAKVILDNMVKEAVAIMRAQANILTPAASRVQASTSGFGGAAATARL